MLNTELVGKYNSHLVPETHFVKSMEPNSVQLASVLGKLDRLTACRWSKGRDCLAMVRLRATVVLTY